MSQASPSVVTVETLMTRQVITVSMDDFMRTAHNLFRLYGFHHLVVTDNLTVVGILSDRDYLRAISPRLGHLSETEQDAATLNKRIHQIMAHRVITVTTRTSREEAARLLLDQGISCLPVLSPDGHLQGILTWKDLMRSLLETQGAPAPCSVCSSA